MDKKHLPYNILLCITIVSVTFMFAHNLILNNSEFSVMVDYSIPVPAANDVQAVQEATVPAEMDFPLELNTASREELMLIPGIGEVLSGRIISRREEIGGFDDLFCLMEVKGVGESTYNKIVPYLYIEDTADK